MTPESDRLQLKLVTASAIVDIFVESETKVYWERLVAMVEFTKVSDRLLHGRKFKKQTKTAEETLKKMRAAAKLGTDPPDKKPLWEVYLTFEGILDKMHYNEFCTVLAIVEQTWNKQSK